MTRTPTPTPTAGAAALLAALVVVAVGLVLTASGRWRAGCTVLGTGLLLAGALRLVLPEPAAGMLAVRGRGLDAAVLLALGAGVVALAGSVPGP